MPSLTIRPGSHVRLKGQSECVPDFLVVRCEGDQCWVRQQSWSPDTQLHIQITEIAVPGGKEAAPFPRKKAKVISLSEYRQKRERQVRSSDF